MAVAGFTESEKSIGGVGVGVGVGGGPMHFPAGSQVQPLPKSVQTYVLLRCDEPDG